jgi:hypothetical protein
LVSFGHCVVCSSIYGFWLPLWFLQTLLPTNNLFSPFVPCVKHSIFETFCGDECWIIHCRIAVLNIAFLPHFPVMNVELYIAESQC